MPLMVEYVQWGIRLAEDPVVALDFFNHSIQCIMECLFGWDFERRWPTEEGGMLGHIRSFYGTCEVTECGSYQIHFLIMLHGGLNPIDVHAKKTQFFSFFKDIIWHDLPMDLDFDAKGNPKAECPPHVPGPDVSEEELEHFLQVFEWDVKYCGEQLQCHHHRSVCNKYIHNSCRFQFPHEFVVESYFDVKTNSVILACCDQMVNYYKEWVLVVCCFNHDLRCILSGKSCKAATFYIVVAKDGFLSCQTLAKKKKGKNQGPA